MDSQRPQLFDTRFKNSNDNSFSTLSLSVSDLGQLEGAQTQDSIVLVGSVGFRQKKKGKVVVVLSTGRYESNISDDED